MLPHGEHEDGNELSRQCLIDHGIAVIILDIDTLPESRTLRSISRIYFGRLGTERRGSRILTGREGDAR